MHTDAPDEPDEPLYPGRPRGGGGGLTGLSDTAPSVADGVLRAESEAMDLALSEAAIAAEHGDVPVGAVALCAGRIVAARHNQRQLLGDPTAHAELLAIRDAAAVLGTWRLLEVTLVVTLEPCAMCAGALVAARVGRLVFAASDPKAGACGSLHNLCVDPRLNHELVVVAGFRADQASEQLTAFFRHRRRRASEPPSP